MMNLLLSISMLVVVIVLQYYTNYDRFLFRIKRMNEGQLQSLGLKKDRVKKDAVYHSTTYRFRDVQIDVKRRRGSLSGLHGTIEIYKGNILLCDYRKLSRRFKSQWYLQYLQVRYPKTLAKVPLKAFRSTNVSKRVYEQLKQANLLEYSEE